MFFRRGETDGMLTRRRRATGETLLVPLRNQRKRCGRITGLIRKSAIDKRVSEGRIVPTKPGNAGGGKAPCCGKAFDVGEARAK